MGRYVGDYWDRGRVNCGKRTIAVNGHILVNFWVTIGIGVIVLGKCVPNPILFCTNLLI